LQRRPGIGAARFLCETAGDSWLALAGLANQILAPLVLNTGRLGVNSLWPTTGLMRRVG